MDQTTAGRRLSRSRAHLWCRLSGEFHIDLLRFIAFHSLHRDVECHGDLSVHHSSLDGRGHVARQEHQWHRELPLPDQCRATTHSREEVVHGTECHRPSQWHSSLRLDLHRNVKEEQLDRQIFFFFRYFIFTSFWAYKVNLTANEAVDSLTLSLFRSTMSTVSCCSSFSFSPWSPCV